ncbi:hypothetical protein Pcinc_001175 [Petrolisthes cinctipes]|uniref:Uncharacterized protein n=1 Tax=Petrolisthes cinctipes TaxID=88211 RepID=A0AAE1GL95_PETCI|nr:hypothetical protein Pcinc_001175 [Petrolisthes cinctipes]
MDELKVLLQTLVHRQEEPNTKAEVREVLDVLEEWPGFNMFRVFTLGRARLVDISSFVVTYIIIFLQFRLTE